jgi:uncharacterized protein YjbJ (UPF0337 family)
MNTDQLEGKWKQVKGQVREKWGKLTDDDMTVIGGRQEQLIGRVQERYGIAKEEATTQVNAFMKSLNDHPRPDLTDADDAVGNRAKAQTAGKF